MFSMQISLSQDAKLYHLGEKRVARPRMSFNEWNDWRAMQNIWKLLQMPGEGMS